MGTIEDIRKVIQDLVALELKALSVKLDSYEHEANLRDEPLAQRMTASDELMLAKLEAITAKMDAQYGSVMYALNLDKRVESLQCDKHSASA